MYVHRSAEDVLPTAALALGKELLPHDHNYHVVKYNLRTRNLSFVACPTFDTEPEPAVGDSFLVKPDGTVKRRNAAVDPELYHHKWLFVRDDYQGFDVQASKERSRQWMELDQVDRARIGRLSYWKERVLPRLK